MGGDGWGVLGEAGVGAAGVAVLPLSALHHAGHLQSRLHRERPVPHLQGAAEGHTGTLGFAGLSFLFFLPSCTSLAHTRTHTHARTHAHTHTHPPLS